MNLYIDYFSTSEKEKNKTNGGANFSRLIISKLANAFKDKTINVLCPEWHEINFDTEPALYELSNINWIKVTSVKEFAFGDGDILFYPLIHRISDFKEIISIRKQNHGLKIHLTIHDLRWLAYEWDSSEKYYYVGVTKLFFSIPILKRIVYFIVRDCIQKKIVRSCLKCVDKVFTVSNYSMQEILRVYPSVSVSCYYVNEVQEVQNDESANGVVDYALFVSGGRRVKNLIHALKGYSIFKSKMPNSTLKIYITGIDDLLFERLCKGALLSDDIKDSIIHEKYVSKEKLSTLYRNCRFLLYPTKSEGFGLPVLEAAYHGKTTIASNTTSVPEVLGAAVRYVYPNDDESIARELSFLSNEANLKEYENRIKNSMAIAKQRIELEQEMFIRDIFIPS